MNQQAKHAFEPEEIMAYLDGELAPGRALEVATHLDHCAECARLAEGIRGTSSQMREWTVEAHSPQMDEVVLSAIQGIPPPKGKKNVLSRLMDWWRANGWVGLAKSPFLWAPAVLLLLFWIFTPSLLRVRFTPEEARELLAAKQQRDAASSLSASRASRDVAPAPPPAASAEFERQQNYARADQLAQTDESMKQAADSGGGNAPALSAVTAPMIAQTASVTLVPSNYDQASGGLEALAKAHGGYVQKLDATAQVGQARSISATLRIPSVELTAFLSDTKKLGRVVEFSQENEEVTDQYVDVTARLKSARTTEQRLIELQSTRTGKLSDVLEVERELERVRGEIEQMQGEQAVLVDRVQYSSVDLSLEEEYRENLRSESTSKMTTIWNAVVEGFHHLQDGIVSLLVFLLAYGPSILFWLAIVGVPVWLIWRRRRRAQSAAK